MSFGKASKFGSGSSASKRKFTGATKRAKTSRSSGGSRKGGVKSRRKQKEK
jgi:hypothetical protein